MRVTTIDSKTRLGGALLAMAIATGVSTAAMGAAPAANATCASFFGLSSGPDCESSFGSIAIAIGSNAIARANGVLGISIAMGQQSYATATVGSFFTLAAALGNSATAEVNGVLQTAISAGDEGRSSAGTLPAPLQFGNVAINLGNHVSSLTNDVSASGFGNMGVNIGGNVMFVRATGVLNNATNLFGSTDIRVDGGALSWAFNVFGDANNVVAGPGFLAIAGSIGQSGATVTQAPFGININGAGFPPSAATIKPAAKHSRPSVRSKSAQSTGGAKSRTAGSAHSARG